MTHLDPSALSILHAIFALGLLTFIMMLWMTAVRLPAMQRAGLKAQDAAHARDLSQQLPSAARRVSDNFTHLAETPTVFYAVALAIVAGGLADGFYAECAWAFLILRVLHSLVQATVNLVAIRSVLYGLSWVPLAAMIIRPLVSA